MDVFNKIGALEQDVFKTMEVFDKNTGMRAVISPWKTGKDGHPINFLDPTYSVVLTELTFFDQKWA